MHISVRMTIHIIIDFCHAPLCTNYYQYSYGFLSCTSLYKWKSILLWFFVIHIFVRMTIHILMDFCCAYVCSNDYPYSNGFCHAHFCTNDYPYSYGFSSCISLHELLSMFLRYFVIHMILWITIHILMGFRHTRVCTNDYQCYYWFSSCTCLFEWISIILWVFVMLIFLRMTIHLLMGFCHAHLCTNDYFVPNLFPMRFCYTGIFLCFLVFIAGINRWGRSPWCLSSHGEFLGVLSSNVSVSLSVHRFPTRE